MNCLRDLLVLGPTTVLIHFLQDLRWGWATSLLAVALLYGLLRVLSAWTGLDRAVQDRRALSRGIALAKKAEKEMAPRPGD